MISEVHNIDCLEYLKTVPDKFFELAICDPPYGIGAGERRGDTGKNKHIKQREYKYGNWDDSAPDLEYFNELFRTSKNQIIWGGNYFALGTTNCYIVWNKKNGDNLYADCELAWTSFSSAVRMFEYRWHGFLQQKSGYYKEQRIHPTQKPVDLYKWLLENYAKQGDKILDTHMGSQSSRIAAYDMVFDYWGTELDKDYFEAGNKRFELFKSQGKLF